MFTTKEQIKRVHDLAVKKGWWGEVPDLSLASILAKLMLVVSEIAEAVEIVREPNFDPRQIWCVSSAYPNVRGSYEWHISNEVEGLGNPRKKPEGFGIEIADAVIRIYDLAGAISSKLPAEITIQPLTSGALRTADDTLAAFMRVVDTLSRASESLRFDSGQNVFFSYLFEAVERLHGIAEVHGVDLNACIDLKHLYNETRPERHGGKRA